MDQGSLIYVLLSVMAALSLLAAVLWIIVQVGRRAYVDAAEAGVLDEAPPPPKPKPAPAPRAERKPEPKPKPEPAKPKHDAKHDHHEPDAKPKPAQRPAASGKSAPLRLSVRDFRGLRLSDFHDDVAALNDFGELVTVASLAAEGWKKLSSKLPNDGGIDVLVVREVRGSGGFEARAIEVKTNDGAFAAETMSDARVEQALRHLHDIGAFDETTFEELRRGVGHGAPYFRKELWRHQLDTGVTTVWELDASGAKTTSQVRSSARLMDSLFQMLKQLDRHGDYVDRPPVPDTPRESEEIAIFDAGRFGRVHDFERSYKRYSRALAFTPRRRA